MSDYRYLPEASLPSYLVSLRGAGYRVLAPRVQEAVKQSVVFTPWQEGDPVVLTKATVPAKAAVLPQCEVLFRYAKTKDPNDLDKTSLVLDDAIEAENTVIFACRTCDAKGITVLDRPYLQGLYKDPYYQAKREKLVVISLTCDSGCDTCFCHFVGGGPTSPDGSDILMTKVAGGFVLQGITDKGKALLESSSLEDGESRVEEMTAVPRERGRPCPKRPTGVPRLRRLLRSLRTQRSGRIGQSVVSPVEPVRISVRPVTVSRSPMRVKRTARTEAGGYGVGTTA